MSTRRLWYVLPLDIEQDPNQAIVHQAGQVPNEDWNAQGIGGFNVNEALLQPAQPRGRQRPAAPVPQVRGGVVFKINSTSKKEFQEACTTKQVAEERAEQLASKFPKRPFGIFECVAVVETMEAPVIKKEFNDAGELRVKPEANADVAEGEAQNV